MILLIDNYDSFTYNLYQYIGAFEPNIVILRNDEVDIQKVYELKPDKIVISPGPKSPSQAGHCIEIIKEFGGKISILGVCLGHQAIGEAYGATVSNAKELFHGKASLIKHSGEGIFEGLPNPMQVARYHSLSIIKETVPDCLEIIAATDDGEIMAVKHKQHQVVGLQFHPESIYTPEGMKMIENFVKG